MSIYDNIRTAAVEKGKPIPDDAVYRIAGTLRSAYDDDVPVAAVLREVIRYLEVSAETERVSAAPITADTVTAAMAKGMCPRCTKQMGDVKLADQTPARYCRTCHISLWA
jgi:hypothetical protein